MYKLQHIIQKTTIKILKILHNKLSVKIDTSHNIAVTNETIINSTQKKEDSILSTNKFQ